MSKRKVGRLRAGAMTVAPLVICWDARTVQLPNGRTLDASGPPSADCLSIPFLVDRKGRLQP